MDHKSSQRQSFDDVYGKGSRRHVGSVNPIVSYLVRWRLKESLAKFSTQATVSGHDFSRNSRILVMCAGDGLEGSVLCDLGYADVTVSDLSPAGVNAALARDSRLKGLVLDAEFNELPACSYELVIVQDGLHHLPSPVQGFTSMMRLASIGVVFLEPHDSIAGRALGTKWERNGDSVNYVFRWSSRLVDDVANSYLGPGSFRSYNFSFWHHNLLLERVGIILGGGTFALHCIQMFKYVLDAFAGRFGNQFAAVIVKVRAR